MMEEFCLDKKKVKQAVAALNELNTKFLEDASRKKQLLDEESESPILLQITLKKIPLQKLIQMIRVPLPYPLIKDSTEVCLITGDLDKRDQKAEIEPTVLHYKELLNRHGIDNISEVIPLRQLRTEYKHFEAKRQLVGAYDVFLADNKIAGVLPKLLGKFFFKKRKFPIQINLKTANLKYQVDKALTSTTFFLTGRGNNCTAEVAHLGLQNKQIIKNIYATLEMLAKSIPGTWENILGLYLKTPKSLALPIYLSFDNPNKINLDVPKETEEVEAEEITTLNNRKVKVYSDGRVQVIHAKTENDSENESANDLENESANDSENDSENDSDDQIYKGRPRKKLKNNPKEEKAGESKFSLPVNKQKSKKRKTNSVKKENKTPKTELKIENEAQEQSGSLSKKQRRMKKKKENTAVKASVKVTEPKQDDGFGSAEFKVLAPSIKKKVKHSLDQSSPMTKQMKLGVQALSDQKQPKEKNKCVKKDKAFKQNTSVSYGFVKVIEPKQVDGFDSDFKVLAQSTKRKINRSLNQSPPRRKQKNLELQVLSDQKQHKEKKMSLRKETGLKQKTSAANGRTRNMKAKRF